MNKQSQTSTPNTTTQHQNARTPKLSGGCKVFDSVPAFFLREVSRGNLGILIAWNKMLVADHSHPQHTQAHRETQRALLLLLLLLPLEITTPT